MAIIVKHNPSGKHYILLGAGYGMWASARPNRLLGDLFAADRNGQSRLLCLCDEQGGVEWAYAERVSIVSVDGLSPSQVLAGFVQPEDAD
ncbi:MAG: hypothetical protein KDA29_14685 [Phycisphaerales bacterium]|nr:hypothetical protein [Phycisphaerales bacterium]